MFSLSATAFPDIELATVRLGSSAGPKVCDLYLFLRFMMTKSHSRDKRCPQGGMRGAGINSA
jgi:hypothetical protein